MSRQSQYTNIAFISYKREDEKTGKIDLKKQTFPEKEVMYALRHNKRLIPLSIDGTTVNDCKWLEFNCSGLDCINWHKKEQREKLSANLQQWCDKPEDKNSKKNGVTTNIRERTLCHNQNFSYNVFKSNIHKCLKDKYATFSGRANRTEFWSFALLEVIIALLAFIIYVSIGTTFIIYVWLIITLGLACPNIAVSVRRLHDIGLNGWWYLASFLPYIGWLGFFVVGCIPSKKENNKYEKEIAGNSSPHIMQENDRHTVVNSNTIEYEVFTFDNSSVMANEAKNYGNLNEEFKKKGKKCNDYLCDFPEATRCAGYKTPYCRYSK